MNDEINWLEEKIDHIEKNNWLYRFSCFFIGRKLTYKEMYVILSKINEKKLGKKESNRKSLIEIIKIYKYLNNKLPDGISDEN